jgi:two-component system LytT family response regulator
MKTIRTLIADDESLARSRLKRLLKTAPQIEVIGECANGKDTIAAVERLAPDALFLDIQMPEMNGFQVLEHLSAGKLPYIVFVTAYDQYALRAFEVYALDYLLKPFNEERILRSVKRLREKFEDKHKQDLNQKIASLLNEIQSAPQFLHRLMIRNGQRTEFIKVREIRWIESEKKCARIHCAAGSHFVSHSIQDLESKLDPVMFLRIHRSVIVNLNFVKEIQNDSAGKRKKVILQEGKELLIGRTFQQQVVSSLLRHE